MLPALEGNNNLFLNFISLPRARVSLKPACAFVAKIKNKIEVFGHDVLSTS
jgi:hypothetical protein